jgi:hypothetical protein
MKGLTTQPIIDDLIASRTAHFEAALAHSRVRGRQKMVDTFRAGMRQMLADLINMELIECVPDYPRVDSAERQTK